MADEVPGPVVSFGWIIESHIYTALSRAKVNQLSWVCESYRLRVGALLRSRDPWAHRMEICQVRLGLLSEAAKLLRTGTIDMMTN